MVATAVGAISEVFGQLKRAAGASERIRELLATPTEIAAPRNSAGVTCTARRGHFRQRDIQLPDATASRGIERLFACGQTRRSCRAGRPSGAGKSTVFQLLLRFYDPRAGVVSVDGVDVKAADLNACANVLHSSRRSR